MRVRAIAWLLLAAALAGCRAGGVRGGERQGRLDAGCRTAVPTASREIPDVVVRARRLIREHQRGAALALLEPERPLSDADPERSWLLVALLSETHRWGDARERVRALPPTAFAASLQALVAERPQDALLVLSSWMGAGSPWVHLAAGLAHGSYGDSRQAHAQATQALRGASAFVRAEAYMLRARVHMDEGRLEQGAADVAAAIQASPRDARPYSLLAEVLRRRGEIEAATDALLDAYERAPGSESYPRRIAELGRAHDADVDWARLASRVDAIHASYAGPARVEAEALAGLVHEHRGETDAAIRAYAQAVAAGCIPVPVERSLRRLLAANGRYGEVVRLLRSAVPPDVLVDPANLRRPHWERLTRAGTAAPSAAAPPGARLELARALVGVGALRESLAVLEGLETQAAGSLRARVAGHVAFERALEAEIEAGYRVAHHKAAPPSFARLLAGLPALAEAHLHPDDRAAFREPARGLKQVPIIGAWLDHGTCTSSPVVAHFRRYGKFLMIGQRVESPTEAIVMSLGSLTEQQVVPTPRGRYRHDVAVGYDRTLRGFINAQGGALGGACLADGIWLDADSTRRVEAEMRRIVTLDPTIRHRVDGLAPVAADTSAGPFALTDVGGAGARMLLAYIDRNPADRWGSFSTLRAHEFSHVADIKRHLPIVRGLPASIALLGRNGFSPSAVEAELERRAQLGAVLLSRDPDLAVVEMMRALPVTDRDPEVHDAGYRDGLELMVRNIYARPALFPEIDRTQRIVSQLDRLSLDQLRRAAALALASR